MARRPGLPGLLLAGAAAYGLYKLSKLSAEERTDLVNKGKKILDEGVSGLKDRFGGATGNQPQTANGGANSYAEPVTYGG